MFCVFEALVLTTWLRDRVRESGLVDDYTLDAMLDEASCIEHAGHRPILGEIAGRQRNIFQRLGTELLA